MNESLFLSFNDDGQDPTYALADEALLVSSIPSDQDENPCVGPNVIARVPALPKSPDEIKAFANLLGWKVEYDSDNRLLINTGLVAGK
jgi:hypothetical protein